MLYFSNYLQVQHPREEKGNQAELAINLLSTPFYDYANDYWYRCLI